MVSQDALKLGTARSSIRELFEYGKKMAAQVGEENVLDFSLGNPSIPAPDAVGEAIAKLLQEETAVALHSYTSSPGSDMVREALAQNLNKRYNAGLSGKNFFMTCGAAPALTAVFRAVVTRSQDEILLIAPYFPEYTVFVRNGGGGVPVVVEADTESFQIDLEKLASKINGNTKAIVINSPNNPSGVVYTRETLEKLARLLEEKSAQWGNPIYLITDEPYRELVYGGIEVPYIPGIYPNTLMCYSYSKSLSLPGERIGYVMVPGCVEEWETVYAAVAGAARGMGHVCAPSLMQRVAALCCDVAPDLTVYESNRNALYDNMTKMGYRCAKPDGAFYLFFEAPHGMTGQAFSDAAKERYNLLLVPGDAFGCPNHLRLSYCVDPKKIAKALPLLETLMKETR